jgi:rRNA maturation RNase YbeY
MTGVDARRGQVAVEDRQGAIPLGPELLDGLRASGTAALGLIRERGWNREVDLAGAAVFLVDDRQIGTVHGEFFGDSSATDVITFPLGNYGEILVSVETARRQAVEFASSFERELTLYIVHGLLHLHGYEDGSTPGREEMARRQEALLEALG